MSSFASSLRRSGAATFSSTSGRRKNGQQSSQSCSVAEIEIRSPVIRAPQSAQVTGLPVERTMFHHPFFNPAVDPERNSDAFKRGHEF
jgi:hypothetical protein